MSKKTEAKVIVEQALVKAEAQQLLNDLADKIAVADEQLKRASGEQLLKGRGIGQLLNEAYRACVDAGQQWGEWLTSSPFGYSTQYANSLRAIADHWALIEEARRENARMGIGEALQVLRDAGVRKAKQKGKGKQKGTKPRLKARISFKTLENAATKHGLKLKLNDLLALLEELKLRAGKQAVQVEVMGRPVEQGK